MDRKLAVLCLSTACFLLSSAVSVTSLEYASTYAYTKCKVDVELRPRSTMELSKAIADLYKDATAKGSAIKIRAAIK
jgi:hypothetical protein